MESTTCSNSLPFYKIGHYSWAWSAESSGDSRSLSNSTGQRDSTTYGEGKKQVAALVLTASHTACNHYMRMAHQWRHLANSPIAYPVVFKCSRASSMDSVLER